MNFDGSTVVGISFKPLTKYRYSNKASSFKGMLCGANPTGHRAAVKNSDVPKPPSGKAARKPLTRTGSADSTMLFIRKRLSTRRCAIENGSYNEFKTYDIVIWQMKNMNVHIGMYQLYPFTSDCNTVVFFQTLQYIYKRFQNICKPFKIAQSQHSSEVLPPSVLGGYGESVSGTPGAHIFELPKKTLTFHKHCCLIGIL